MNIRHRLVLSAALCVSWFGILGPLVSTQIHTQTLQGPQPFSVQNIRTRLSENSDTGSSQIHDDLQDALADLAALELAEEERVMAMWGVIKPEVNQQAAQLIPRLPPLKYAVDPRFFEPIVPTIIRQSLERYGYSIADLERTNRMTRPADMDRKDVLMRILSAVHHELLSPEEAAMILQGSMDLLAHQTQRMKLESELKTLLDGSLSN